MPATISAPPRPLCVDMDGTLVATDLLWESVLLLARERPLRLPLLPLWLLGGKASFKRKLAEQVVPEAASLPYREDVLALLRTEHAAGRDLVLATAGDRRVAQKVAEHLGIFSTVLASDGATNLSGARKVLALQKHVNGAGFDYIGNSRDDLPVWLAAKKSILVNPPSGVLRAAVRQATAHDVMRTPNNKARALIKALRVHQWVKNALLFVPLVVGHRLSDLNLVVTAVFAFVAFSLCASAVYIMNDLLDLEADRTHPRKRKRPFASGALAIPTGLALVPLLLGSAFLVGITLVSAEFTMVLGVYLALTTLYSVYIKRVLLLDVFLLAGLYTLRVLAGGIATSIPISPWLAAFSMFFFINLAFLKRFSELRLLRERQGNRTERRDYAVADMDLIRSLGPCSGYLAVLVLALYINGADTLSLYSRPVALWLLAPLLLYWVTRMWFFAHRGQMDDDPIVFTVRDRASYVIGMLVGAVMMWASW